MVKKLFALASVTALTGLVAATGAACTTETTETPADAGPGDAATKKETGTKPPVDEKDGEPTDPELVPTKTTGKECKDDSDCEGAANAVNQNLCSKGAFKDGDIYGSPVCLGECTPNANAKTVADLMCDGETGLCLGSSTSGLCVPACSYDSTTVDVPCAGGNKCAPGYTLEKTEDGTGAILGYCWGACTADADCKGSAGQKCQKETGSCVKEANLLTFAKAVGEGCNSAATPDDCNCSAVGGTGADKSKGFCTHSCITGTAGDAACGSVKAGWKCTVGLYRKDDDGKDIFTGQPDDVLGVCAQPCTTDTDCAGLKTAAGLNGSAAGAGTVVCTEFSNGKFCNATEIE
jgi:hypothetical protein